MTTTTTPTTPRMQDVRLLRESLDRADALASAQARTIAALEGSLAVYGLRMTELEKRLADIAEASR